MNEPARGAARHTDADALARTLIEGAEGRVRLALPLGVGKAVTIANALTRAAIADPSIELSIFTALTLERPSPSSDLERRFLEPALDRLFGRYPPLVYAQRLRAGDLPANIEVREFFLLAGRWLMVDRMQRHYTSANYSHAAGYLLDDRPNVVAQLLATDGSGGLSLSGNPDITVDLLAARREGDADFVLAGETNAELPFMDGAARCDGEVDHLLDHGEGGFELFSAVKRPVTLADHAVGLRISRLVRDGGTLQIGIGSIGDAVAHALILRHAENPAYREIVSAIAETLPADAGDDGPFEGGLYAVTEMLVDGLLRLFEAGVIRREVDGAAIHAGFFVDSRDFYRRLREMPAGRRRKIAMGPVSFTNTLFGDEAGKRAARRDARFINNAMNVTALGAAASDTLPDGRVVSGVGGQHDFVTQAFALRGARSIIALNATRESGGRTLSNIVWSHAQATLPRHLRDIVVTEYGIADLRGQTDESCILSLAAIADARFQDDLIEQGKGAGKVAGSFRIPEAWRRNTRDHLQDVLGGSRRSFLPTFPFGTDFTDVEQRLLPALSAVRKRSHSRPGLARLVWQGLRSGAPDEEATECLVRLDLADAGGAQQRLLRWAMLGGLSESRRA